MKWNKFDLEDKSTWPEINKIVLFYEKGFFVGWLHHYFLSDIIPECVVDMAYVVAYDASSPDNLILEITHWCELKVPKDE